MSEDTGEGWGKYSYEKSPSVPIASESFLKESELDKLQWAIDFIRTFPPFGFNGTDFNGPSQWYGKEYVLDLMELVRRSEYTYRMPSSAEFGAMTQGISFPDVKKIADQIAQNTYAAHDAVAFRDVLMRIRDSPLETIEALNKALAYLVVDRTDDQYDDFVIPRFRITNADEFGTTIRDLSLRDDEETLVQSKGWLTYVQDPIAERITWAKWLHLGKTPKGSFCGGENETYGSSVPDVCVECDGGKGRFELTEKVTEKFQECLLTENFEDSSGFPSSLKIILLGRDTGGFSPGDRVTVVGILKPEEIKQKDGTIIFRHLLEVISVKREDDRTVTLTAEDRKDIEQFLAKGSVLTRLTEMFAPHIIGNTHIKRAMILQAAGSPDWVSGIDRERGNIHILMIGDPGIGKSQLLRANQHLSPKSLYVSDASAAGLTAAISDVNGKRVMVAGVLVLADGGIAAIDELDKMKKDDREGIHPAMEQGYISKSKAGLHAHFQTRTSILAAANPKWGRFEPDKPLSDQITLEVPLMNRFDLIFIMVDRAGADEYEAEKAMKILQSKELLEGGSNDFIMKYISRAREIDPTIPDDVNRKISAFYSSLRKKESGTTINPRTLGAIRRLTHASSRLRLSEIANEEDFENAKELIELYLSQFNFDLDAISGITSSIRNIMYTVENLIRMHGVIHKDDILKNLENNNVGRGKVTRALEELYKSGSIYDAGHDRYGVV